MDISAIRVLRSSNSCSISLSIASILSRSLSSSIWLTDLKSGSRISL
ncbi:hypothetical protein LEQ41_03570 [Streptococcus agalactiae]|nr:hypothetical protein [Streptococcus agalactiae]